jgi:hypothetical protein
MLDSQLPSAAFGRGAPGPSPTSVAQICGRRLADSTSPRR